jgi:RNA polymerase sigma-70 factor (ECF subfamily)
MDALATTSETLTGVSDAFEECYRRHWREVFALCLRYGAGNVAWAEDLAHDVFVRLLEKLPELSDQADLGGWLYRVTANRAISRLRREQSWMGRFARAWRAVQGQETTPEAIVVQREHARAALRTLQALPPSERVVVCMKLLDGKTQVEIASMLGLSEGYVSKVLKRGLARIEAEGWQSDE